MTERVLKLLDWLSWFFRMINVDYPMMRHIVRMKLKMDQRRVPTVYQNGDRNDRDGKKDRNYFVRGLWVYFAYGLVTIPFLFLGGEGEYFLQLGIIFGIMMFVLGTSIISDFSAVMLDIRDQTILGTKPVDKRTIAAARIVHIVVYLTLLTGAFTLIPVIVSFGVNGILFGLLFIVEIFFLVIFLLVLMGLLYLVVLNFFDGDRLKNIISYVQVALTVSVAVGYQIVIRAFDFADAAFTMNVEWWHVFIPSFWFAAVHEVVLNGDFSGLTVVLASLSVIVPVGSLALYVKLLPGFERSMQKLTRGAAAGKRLSLWTRVWGRIVFRRREEQAFYRFAGQVLRSERDFKTNVFPAIAISVFFPFLLMFNAYSFDGVDGLRSGLWYLGIYAILTVAPSVVVMSRMSAAYKASWVFFSAPVSGRTMMGRVMVVLLFVHYVLPVWLVTSVLLVVVRGVEIVPELLVVAVSGFVFVMVLYKVVNRGAVPFSESFSFAQQNLKGVFFVSLFVVGGVYLLHMVVRVVPYGVMVYLGALVVVAGVMWFWWMRREVVAGGESVR